MCIRDSLNLNVPDLSKEEALRFSEQLREELNRHNYYYYIKDNPVITDDQYDKLLKNLFDLEKKYPEAITSDSPTQRIGAPLEGGFPTAVSYTHLDVYKRQHISLANPVDLTGTATEEDYEAAISAAVSDKNIDIIMIYIVFHVSTMTEKMLDIVAKYADKKPIIFCSIGADHTISMKNLLEKKNIPTFSSVEELSLIHISI